MEAERLFGGNDRDEDFRQLRDQLEALGVSVPVLYKQYCDVAEPGGVRFMDFGVDAAFGYCLDGLVVVDVERLKPEKRRRYIGTAAGIAPGGGGALVTAGRSLPTQTA